MPGASADTWYTRPILFVAEMERALEFYRDMLGFKQSWGYKDKETTIVTQLHRGDCEIILTFDKARAGGGRIYVSLEDDEMARLKDEIRTKSVPANDFWWGSPAIRIEDPDGNELLFPLADAEEQA